MDYTDRNYLSLGESNVIISSQVNLEAVQVSNKRRFKMLYKAVLRVVLFIVLLTSASCSRPTATTPKGIEEAGEAEITEAKEIEAPEVHDIGTVRGGPEDPNSDAFEVIISLGDNKLTMEQIKWVHPSATDYQIASFVTWWLNNELLYAEAEKRGIADEPRAKFLAELMRKNVLQKELVTNLQDAVQVTDDDVLAHYEKNKEVDPKLTRPGYLGFSHVRTTTRDEAEAALERIKAGEKIEELAKKLSIASDGRRGGTVQRITYERIKNSYSTKFFEAITAARINELIGPIELEQNRGYEVARKDSDTKPKPKPFEEVKDSIKSRLQRTEKQKVVQDLVDSLKEKAAEEIVKSPRLIEAEKAALQGARRGGPPVP
jgi:hypothetical protein